MRYWVFHEDQLDEVLDAWCQRVGESESAHMVMMKRATARDFLNSEEAKLLRGPGSD